MKKLTLIALVLTLIAGCTANETLRPTQESLHKAEQFQMGEQSAIENSPFQYVFLESLAPDYKPQYMSESAMIIFTYGNNDRLQGSAEFEKLISLIPIDNNDEMGVQARADLQMLSYFNLEHLLLKENQTQEVAKNLRRLMHYTKPLESRILSKALLVATPDLTKSEINSYSKYLSQLNKKGFSRFEQLNSQDISRLNRESKIAIELIDEAQIN